MMSTMLLQDKANLERQLKQLNSRSSMLEKNLEKKDLQVSNDLLVQAQA